MGGARSVVGGASSAVGVGEARSAVGGARSAAGSSALMAVSRYRRGDRPDIHIISGSAIEVFYDTLHGNNSIV